MKINEYKTITHDQAQELGLSEYIHEIMKHNDRSFGYVFREINDYYTITSDENESDIISALWELDVNDKRFVHLI